MGIRILAKNFIKMIPETKLTSMEILEIQDANKYFLLKSVATKDNIKIIQQHLCVAPDEEAQKLSALLERAPARTADMAIYYGRILRRKVGRNIVLVCNSVNCWIMGCDKITACLKTRLSIDFGETTPDDRFTLLPIPCLGACDHAPAMIINEELHGDLSTDGLSILLNQCE